MGQTKFYQLPWKICSEPIFLKIGQNLDTHSHEWFDESGRMRSNISLLPRRATTNLRKVLLWVHFEAINHG